MEELVYLNGRFVSKSKAKISVFDYGFCYGDGLFETMRSYNGQVFRLAAHLERLFSSSKIIDLKIPLTRDQLKQAAMKIIRHNKLDSACLRLTISRGVSEERLEPSSCQQATVVLSAAKLKPYPKEFYQEGIKTIVSSIRRNERSVLSRLKSLSFLDSLLAREEARERGADGAIMLNSQDYVSEASTSNLFMVKGGKLFTPPIEAGCLPGITRQVVVGLANRLSIGFRETLFRLNDLAKADEIFLTNSLAEIMPVTRLDDKEISSGRPGSITKELTQSYRKLVEEETKA